MDEKNQQGKNWCFTLNNYTDADEADIDHQGERLAQNGIKYIVYGREVGENGTPHLQGFMVFSDNKRLSAVRKFIAKAHWELARGTSQQAAAYCKKGTGTAEKPENASVREWGECPALGKKGGEANAERWAVARKAAEEGRWADIDDKIYISHLGNLEKIRDRAYKPKKFVPMTKFYWVWGPTGTGKSRAVQTFFGDMGVYPKQRNRWWCGYDPTIHGCVEIAEVEPADAKELTGLFKVWFDHYPFVAERKGGNRLIRPEVLVVTSNYSIEQVFGERGQDYAALVRRFKIIHVWEVLDPNDNIFQNLEDYEEEKKTEEKEVKRRKIAETDEDPDWHPPYENKQYSIDEYE